MQTCVTWTYLPVRLSHARPGAKNRSSNIFKYLLARRIVLIVADQTLLLEPRQFRQTIFHVGARGT
jgi:hypothetical protein